MDKLEKQKPNQKPQQGLTTTSEIKLCLEKYELIDTCYSLTETQSNPQGQLSGYKRTLGEDDYSKFISGKLLDIAVLFDTTLNEPQLKTLFALIKSDFWMLDISELKWMFEGIKIQSFNKFYAGNIYPNIEPPITQPKTRFLRNAPLHFQISHKTKTKE